MLKGIFDSHAHYDDEKFDPDRDRLLLSLPGQGVCGILNCASDLAAAQVSVGLANRYPYVFAAVGIHPHEVKDAPVDWREQLEKLVGQPGVAAVGEIGLDYHYDFSPRGLQKEFLCGQLAFAKEHGLPVVLHDREAHGDMMEILRRYRPKGVMHCYSGGVEMMKELVSLGMHIGLGGAVTFKNARVPLQVAKAVPADRLLLETDAPYMTPAPYRGKRNDSSLIPYAARRIAEERGEEPQALVDRCRENAVALFRIGTDRLNFSGE